MQVTYATEAAPGAVNEDYIVTGPSWVAVFDGATPRAGVESGCIHTVPWLVQRLGADLARSLALAPDVPLSDALAKAITTVCAAHDATCDLSNPDSPSSTVVTICRRGDQLDYLILGDSPLLLDVDGIVQALTDERSGRLPSYTPEGVRAARNQPDGFWIASTKPEAAHHAVTGSVPIDGLRRAALLSDGATRYVERLGLGKWPDLLDQLDQLGPVELIRIVRTAELAQLPLVGQEPNGRMVKQHDDATAALVRF